MRSSQVPVAVVTGASTGIGFATACGLARRGFELVLVASRAERLRQAAARIAAEHAVAVRSVPCDLSSQAEVRRLALGLADHERIDVLVNNAGIFPGRRSETVDGIERCLAVNYLAPYLLTRLLLPQLARAQPGRVVNVSSSAQSRGRIRLDDLSLAAGYGRLRAYDQSKLAIIAFTYELARRVLPSPVLANAVDPGWVRTPQTRQPGPYWIINFLARPIQVSPARGATASLAAALASGPGRTGQFLGPDGQPMRSASASYDLELCRELWDVSEAMTGLPALHPR